jgi:hypothetical protein
MILIQRIFWKNNKKEDTNMYISINELLELKLYKFIHENNFKISWAEERLLVSMRFSDINNFVNIMGSDCFGNGSWLKIGMPAYLYFNEIDVDLIPICKRLNINPENILKKEQ